MPDIPIFFDGDNSALNDWVAVLQDGFLSFQAPENVELKWGSLVSFRFVTDREPVEVSASLKVSGDLDPGNISIRTFSGADWMFRDGFEQQPSN